MDDHDGHEPEDHDRGLAFDMSTLLARRRVLSLFAGAGIATIVAACSSGNGGGDTAGDTSTSAGSAGSSTTASTAASVAASTAASTAATASSATAATDAASCAPIPEETAGPFPGDGTNGANVLTDPEVVRSDIRSSFGSSSGVADGVPLTIALTITDTAGGCAPLAGAAVYAWHCDRDGNYSLYSDAAANENYLRGVQEADSEGRVTFTSIFPACYSGRWPHVHFEIFDGLEGATSGRSAIATSQLAFPKDVCDTVYATEGYERSVSNLAQVSLERDNVFSDGVSQQLATMSGDVAGGYVATLAVPV
ncbi:MAG: intradiol ring-cleavage dioxygenase [Acidimicrobiia bacterium]